MKYFASGLLFDNDGVLVDSHSASLEAWGLWASEYAPTADWNNPKNAGQRAQVIKKDRKKGGILQFGTEVVTSADGSISGLLGASPGASTAVFVMLQVLERSFAADFDGWQGKLKQIIPSFGTKLSADPKVAAASLAATAKTLKIN